KVDYTVLSSIESMLGCHVVPCLVSGRVMSKWLQTTRGVEEDPEHRFDGVSTTSEMLRISLSYAARLRCDEIRIARCGSQVWVRLSRRQEVTHLLFRAAESGLGTDFPRFPAAV